MIDLYQALQDDLTEPFYDTITASVYTGVHRDTGCATEQDYYQ